MTWRIEWKESARKELRKLNKQAQSQIISYLKESIEKSDNPKNFGKPLVGNLKGLWRYRIGDYRAVCQIQDEKITVLVVRIAHRKEVYDN